MGKLGEKSCGWDRYFEERRILCLPEREASFAVYTCGLGERLSEICDQPAPLLVLIHGAGTSSLSWCLFIDEIRREWPGCRCIAADLRGHGSTKTSNDTNLSMCCLVDDQIAIVAAVCEQNAPICIVGHSLGGAIAIRTAQKMSMTAAGSSHPVRLLVVVDFTEGNAVGSLYTLERQLKSRPNVFSSQREACDYLVCSGQVRNRRSLRISTQGYFKPLGVEKLEDISSTKAECNWDTNERDNWDTMTEDCIPTAEALPPTSTLPTVKPTEHVQGRTLHHKQGSVDSKAKLVSEYVTWRVALLDTRSHWDDWFIGATKAFLALSTPKLLVLNTITKLDTELTVAQMRGQYQLVPCQEGTSHAINEDAPEYLASIVITALRRYRIIASS